MKRVYIAGPISKGDLLANIHQAERAFEVLLNAGLAPWVPHWSCYHGSAHRVSCAGPVVATACATAGAVSHDKWLNMDLAWVKCADAVLRLPGESHGADLEVAQAVRYQIPIFHSVDEVLAWAKHNSVPSPTSTMMTVSNQGEHHGTQRLPQ